MKKYLIFTLLVIGSWSLVIIPKAFANLYPIGITPLKMDISSRAISLGGAMTAVPDIDSQFYNPACLPWAKGISVDLKDLNNISASQAYPLGNNMSIGLSFASNMYQGLLTSNGTTVQTSGSTIVLAFSSKLSSVPFFPEDISSNIGIGASLKYLLNQNFSETGSVDKTGSGYDIDAGIYAKILRWLSAGVSGHNILPNGALGGGVITWTGISGKEGIPAYIRIGTAAKIIGDLYSPIYAEGHELLLSGDFEKYANFNRSITSAGLEYAFQNNIFLRGGIKSLNAAQNYSYFGLGYKAEGWGINLLTGVDPVTLNNSTYFNIFYLPEKWFFLPNPIENLLPADNFETYQKTVEVTGIAKRDIAININKKPAIIDPGLTFKYLYSLEPGPNLITIESIYEAEHIYKSISVLRKKPPVNPFANLNIFNNFSVDAQQVAIKGRLMGDANAVQLNGEGLPLSTDLVFEKSIPLNIGENNIVFTVYFGGEKADYKYLVYRTTPLAHAMPEIEEPPPPQKIAKNVKTKHKKKHRKYKSIKTAKMRSFAEIRELILKKTGFAIKGPAKFKMSGYFGVYVLSDYQFLVLRDLKNGLIAIEYYETKHKTWKTLAKAAYSELLMFKTTEIEDGTE